jgi:tetratricopeptide (TPR) repeat protein
MRPQRLLLLAACSFLAIASPARAQRGATGPIADLNAQAQALSETAPDQSLVVALKAQTAARAARDVRGEAEALNYISYAHRNQSLLELARTDALESVRLYVQAGDRWGEAQGYNTLGLVEADAGRFPDALQYHLKALAIREKDGDKEGLAYTSNNLGNMYRNMGDYQKALEYHERGLRLKIELGLKSSEAYSHHNIGLVHFARKDYEAAVAAYRRGMVIREQLNDPRSIAVSLNAIGQVEALTNPEAALATYQRALVLRRQTGDQRGEMATEINLADVYRRLNRLPDAVAALNRGMKLGSGLDAPLMHSNAMKALSDVEAQRGNYAAAYRHQMAYQEARDKIFNQETAQRFHHLEAAQETERRQQQIALLERESALQDAELARVRTTRTALAVIAMLVIVSLASLYARFRQKQRSEARLQKQAAELVDALGRVQTLRGLLPICAWCKKIRDDNGYWTQVESYIAGHSAAEFTHCMCPACYDTMTENHQAQPLGG